MRENYDEQDKVVLHGGNEPKNSNQLLPAVIDDKKKGYSSLKNDTIP